MAIGWKAVFMKEIIQSGEYKERGVWIMEDLSMFEGMGNWVQNTVSNWKQFESMKLATIIDGY